MDEYAWVVVEATTGCHVRYFADRQSAREYCALKTAERQREWGFPINTAPNSQGVYTVDGRPFLRVLFTTVASAEDGV